MVQLDEECIKTDLCRTGYGIIEKALDLPSNNGKDFNTVEFIEVLTVLWRPLKMLPMELKLMLSDHLKRM